MLTSSGRRTTVVSAPFRWRWSHFLESLQTRRISWSAEVALQSMMVHPPAGVRSEMELLDPACRRNMSN